MSNTAESLIIGVGDSIMGGAYVQKNFHRRIVAKYRPLFGSPNYGAPAQVSSVVATNYSTLIRNQFTNAPIKYLLVEGTFNDTNFRTGANSGLANAAGATAFTNISGIVTQADADTHAGTDVWTGIIWVNLTPCGLYSGTTAAGVAAIKTFNASVAAYTTVYGTPLYKADAYTLLADNAAGNNSGGIAWTDSLSYPTLSSGTKPDYMTTQSPVTGGTDGGHPNDLAVEALATLIVGALPGGSLSKAISIGLGLGIGV